MLGDRRAQESEPRRAGGVGAVMRRKRRRERKRLHTQIRVDRRHDRVAPIVDDVPGAGRRTVSDRHRRVDMRVDGEGRREQKILRRSLARHERSAREERVRRNRRLHAALSERRCFRRRDARTDELLVRRRRIRVDLHTEDGRLLRRLGTGRGRRLRCRRGRRETGTAERGETENGCGRSEERHG